MKKIILLFSICCLALTSCSDDDDDSFTSEYLIGKWQCEKVTYSGTTTVTTNGETSTIGIKGQGINYNMTSLLHESNTLLTEGFFNVEITTSLDNYTEVYSSSKNLQLLTGNTWSQDGSRLVVDNLGTEDIYTIVELTTTTMVISASKTEDLDLDGQDRSATLNFVATYRRIN